jgi:hypothetical protein
VSIENNPQLYDAYADRYLQDVRFLDRIEEIFNGRYLTRTGEPHYDPAELGLDAGDAGRIADSIANEPLKLIRHIVENDLPYSDVVLADYTMSDPLLSAIWDLDYPSGATGWQPAHYRDGRPERGVLTMTTMWTRHPSAGVNANRHRANTVSTVLLCDDYLARPVSFSRTQIDALTSGDPEDVIRDNATCQSCHSSLDPLAAHFFGFWWEIEGDRADQTLYRPEDEPKWRDYSGKPPGYFGRPTSSIEELAEQIATDERFVDCGVQTVYEGLVQRQSDDVDWPSMRVHRDAFTESGLLLRDLVRSIVVSREYKAGDTTDPALAERLVTVKTASPSQLAAIIEDKTGYRWRFDGRDGLTKNDLGLQVLAGGIDSLYVTTPNYDPSVGLVFTHERLAQAAAWHVATHDLDADRADEAILLRYVTIEDVPESSPEAFETQIRELYRDVTGVPLVAVVDADGDVTTDPHIEALIDLWKQLYSVEASPVSAWAGVVSVVLRDPQVLFF